MALVAGMASSLLLLGAPEPDTTCENCGHTRRVQIPRCDAGSFEGFRICGCRAFSEEP